MIMNNIQEWLSDNNRSYQAGIALYNQYKTSNKHDKFFSSVSNPEPGGIHFNLLITQLQNISRKLKQNPSLVKGKSLEVKKLDPSIKAPKASQHEAKRPRVVDNPLVDVKELPEDLQEKYFENKNLVKERSRVHAEMSNLPEDKKYNQERKEKAAEVLKLDNAIAGNWKAIDTWWKKKQEGEKAPEKQKDAVKEALEKKKRVGLLKNYINREQKKMEKDPSREKEGNKKIRDWEQELEKLENELR